MTIYEAIDQAQAALVTLINSDDDALYSDARRAILLAFDHLTDVRSLKTILDAVL